MAQINMKQAVGFLVAGAMVGSAIALLYAPQSGIRTKKDIKKFARKTVNRLDEIQEDIRDQVGNWVDDMAEVIQDGVDRGKKLSAGGYERVVQGFENVKKSVEDGRSRFEQLIKTA